jgi:hypothetical protein
MEVSNLGFARAAPPADALHRERDAGATQSPDRERPRPQWPPAGTGASCADQRSPASAWATQGSPNARQRLDCARLSAALLGQLNSAPFHAPSPARTHSSSSSSFVLEPVWAATLRGRARRTRTKDPSEVQGPNARPAFEVEASHPPREPAHARPTKAVLKRPHSSRFASANTIHQNRIPGRQGRRRAGLAAPSDVAVGPSRPAACLAEVART